jgi:hypothetical protein
MGQAFPIRTGILAAFGTSAETVERAYHPVLGQVSRTSIRRQQAHTILINSIPDSAARPCDVDLLCCEGLIQLTKEEKSRSP